MFIKELGSRYSVLPLPSCGQARYYRSGPGKIPYGASIEDAVWKHKYDIFYIKHQSLMLDIKILLLTVKTVLFGMGQ